MLATLKAGYLIHGWLITDIYYCDYLKEPGGRLDSRLVVSSGELSIIKRLIINVLFSQQPYEAWSVTLEAAAVAVAAVLSVSLKETETLMMIGTLRNGSESVMRHQSL